MIPQDQIKAIAELDGHTISHWENERALVHVFGDHFKLIPPYLTSLDAIVPVIKKQPPAVLAETSRCLLVILKDYWLEFDKDVDWTSQIMCVMAAVQTTPPQLCEALLRATGKWKN